MQMFVDVILPLALANTYTYRVPDELQSDMKFGVRVIVPLRKKFYTALIYKVHFTEPEGYEVKELISVLDEESVVRPNQVKLWEWIAQYYRCTLGEVFKAALPSGLKLESETKVSAVIDFVADAPLKEKEQMLLDELAGGALSLAELNKALDMKNVLPLVKRMMEMGAVEISENVEAKYKPRMEFFVRLSDSYARESELQLIIERLEKHPKQLQVLVAYLQLSQYFQLKQSREVSKKELLKDGGSDSSLNTLVKNGVLEVFKKEVGRLNQHDLLVQPLSELSPAQQEAYDSIVRNFQEKQTVLLHGVTSSGKTEIYLHLIKKMMQEGRQTLFLLPEIALTTQITNRLRRVLGNKMLVYHSKFSDAERVEVWKKLLDDQSEVSVILGVRSSVFLPFKNLGLVIVDEEHETTYKQYDPSPRYHAGNASIVLANLSGAKVLLGSATPSVESYANAQKGKFGLVELTQRFEGIELPEILVADIKEARKRKEMIHHFTPLLIEQMKKAFERKEQVILFQNRRGYSPYMECRTCSASPRCVNCDISLTFHKNTHQLVCHYCGYAVPVPLTCPACETPALSPVGLGTEQIEDEVTQIFPDVKVARLDLDVAKSRKSYETIISQFEKGEIDVLVGTQMISKGLDFERVRLVGIMNADASMNIPDFRSRERSFQMFSQVAGRAGRKNNRGIVVIQTSSPDNPVIQMVQTNNYAHLFHKEMTERSEFRYPPYFRLINIYLKSKDARVVNGAALCLAQGMRKVFGDRVLGPDRPLVARIQTFYLMKIMLKIEVTASFEKAKQLLRELENELLAQPQFKGVMLNVDVDPM
jgi:primosomal protein N' (replication factor Y)